MIPITINGKKTVIPAGWKDVTIRQFIDLLHIRSSGESEHLSFVKQIAIITNLDYDDILHAEVNLDETLLPLLQWFIDVPNPEKWKVPEVVHLTGRTLTVPKDLDFEAWGQKILYQQMEDAEIKRQMNLRQEESEYNKNIDFSPLIIPVLAIYLCPAYYEEKFNDDKVDSFMKVVSSMSCVEAWPTAFFLFRKYSALKSYMVHNSKPMSRYRVFSWLRKLALKSLADLERLELSTRYRKEKSLITKK